MPKRTDFTEWAEEQLAPLGQAPETVLDDQTEMLDWARLGLEAAVRARAAKLPKKKPGCEPG